MAKYYKYKYSDFVQPILTGNGTVGGNNFAVVASSELDYDMKAFCAFDGVNSTSESGNWHSASGSSHWLNFYNPKQLKISKIIIHNRPSTSTGAVNSIGNFRILNSNDNSNWEQAYSGQNTNNSSKAQIVVDIPDTAEPAKYWSINILSNLETTYTAIGEIEIEAQEVTLVEATKDDYDVVEYDYCVVKKPKYYKYQTWVQPTLTSNSSSSVMTVSATDEGQHEAYKALDNSSSTFWCTTNNATTATLTTTFNENIYISSIQIVGLSTDWGYTKTIQISSESGVIGETKTFNTATSQTPVTNTWTFAVPIKAKQLIFNCTGSLWVAIVNIKITAKKAVEANKDDYDVIEYEPCLVQGKRTITYQDFVQPVLTSNTSNPNFVVSTDLNKDGYKAFDSDTARGEATHSSAGSYSNQNRWLQMKTKNGLNITNLAISNRGDISGKNAVTAGSVQVSNNGETWTKITDWTNSNTTTGATWNIPLSYDGYYKYTRLYITSGYSDNSGNNIALANIALTATEEVIEQPVYAIKN